MGKIMILSIVVILVTWVWVPISSPFLLASTEGVGASSEYLPYVTLQYPVTLIPNLILLVQDPPFDLSNVPFDPST